MIFINIILGATGGATASYLGYSPADVMWWIIFSPFLIFNMLVYVVISIRNNSIITIKEKSNSEVSSKTVNHENY